MPGRAGADCYPSMTWGELNMGTRHYVAASLFALVAATAPGVASAQDRVMSQPALPLSEALQRIAAEWGKPLNIDPDPVRGIHAKSTVNSRSKL